MNKRTIGRAKSRQGAAMVEFAISVPIVFTMFFAAFEFSRVSMIRHTADNAAYEATRNATLPGATAAGARDEAERILSSLGLSDTNISVTPAQITSDTEEVTVRIVVPVEENSFIPTQFFTGKSIESELTMRREGKPSR